MKRYLLFFAYFISFLPVLLTFEWGYIFYSSSSFFLSIGRLAGLLGVILLLWQYILGNRVVVGLFSKDLHKVNKIHKLLGKYGYLLILLHPTLLVLVYFFEYNISLLTFDPTSSFSVYKTVGTLAFLVLTSIWLLSAFLRHKISFRNWKFFHLATYIILPLTLLHSIMIGAHLKDEQLLRIYWLVLLAIYLCITVTRLLAQLGVLKSKYMVINKHYVTENVTQIWLQPLGKKIQPKIGQFIYIQRALFGEAHPFTVSHLDTLSGNMAISPKCSGPFSCELQKIENGSIVMIDGAYGLFTQRALRSEKPVVLIAGGIGITPFLRLLHDLTDKGDEVWLFYGNRTEEDIAYSAELQEIEKTRRNFKVIHVLSRQEEYGGHKGYITIELISGTLPKDLDHYHYCICGPAPMMESITKGLKERNVKEEEIETERFSI